MGVRKEVEIANNKEIPAAERNPVAWSLHIDLVLRKTSLDGQRTPAVHPNAKYIHLHLFQGEKLAKPNARKAEWIPELRVFLAMKSRALNRGEST